jgi:hypothetical protein
LGRKSSFTGKAKPKRFAFVFRDKENIMDDQAELYREYLRLSRQFQEIPTRDTGRWGPIAKQIEEIKVQLKCLSVETVPNGGITVTSISPRRRCERDFEDRVILPLLDRLGLKYQREYRCVFLDNYGKIDIFVSDEKGTLTLFENKAEINNPAGLEKACNQAKKYAHWYRLPSFVIASPQSIWIYSLRKGKAQLNKKLSIQEAEEKLKETLLALRSLSENSTLLEMG